MRRALATAAVAVIVVAAATAAGSTATGPAAAAPQHTVGYTPPPIHWKACSGSLGAAGAQCGYLVVPLDYAHPTGTKIELAVSRVRHTKAGGRYQGVMLVNPGGPGDSGRGLATLGRYVPGHAGEAFDWIGFDPRGVGASKPALTCQSTYLHGDRPPYDPTTRAIYNAWLSRSKAYAAKCRTAKARELLDHVRTLDSVNDMESLRIALGQKQISYYGFSYGTYLGEMYATLHPDRVKRLVFDGTVDPHRVFYASNLDQDVAFQKTFTIYLTWLAQHDSVFHVGATYPAVRATYLAAVAALDRHAAGGVLGGDELIDDFTDAGYYVYDWADIGAAFSAYVNHGDAHALIDMYRSANPTSAGADNSYAMYLATQCTDAPWPRNQARLDRDSARLNVKNYYFTWSNAWFNGPCAYWPGKAHAAIPISGRYVRSHVLMIGETYDAATPFSGSLVVRRMFPTASLIEGKDGTTHAGSLSGVSCTDDTIATYLRTGRVPARRSGNRSDKICPPVPRPSPGSGSDALGVDLRPAALRPS